jgi:arabinan endo-1,5-alpha-L-arabinosidase
LIPLEEDGTRQGTAMYSLASRPSTAIEAPFVFRRGDYYYLFHSVDLCCQGADSTYRIMVGRSTSIAGPYVDRVGNPLLSGGGTQILEGVGPWRGPGHNAILETATATFNVYHSYDADNGGVPTLRIAPIEWASDDWPASAGP